MYSSLALDTFASECRVTGAHTIRITIRLGVTELGSATLWRSTPIVGPGEGKAAVPTICRVFTTTCVRCSIGWRLKAYTFFESGAVTVADLGASIPIRTYAVCTLFRFTFDTLWRRAIIARGRVRVACGASEETANKEYNKDFPAPAHGLFSNL